MSLTTVSFFAFLFVSLLLFYLIRPAQKYILLAASVFFYICISPGSKIRVGIIMLAIGLITYLGALGISRAKGRLKSASAFLSITALVSLIIIFKLAFNIASSFASIFDLQSDFSWLSFGAVVGMSYYTLSAIGYLIDVYWGNVKADKNIAEVFLFIFFFPQLISGPISRFDQMQPQFAAPKAFDMDRISLGIRRMAWGYFKKLVISERFDIIVRGVFFHYEGYSLVGMMTAAICYIIRLYTDFSGCMDIIMGAAYMFGIELPENFKAPFFSESTQEFWQRWHVTLASWFKDYAMYPLQKTKLMLNIGKWSKKVLGKKRGKKVPMYLCIIVLWVLIGLWHGGTVYYFFGSGMFPCTLLILGDAFSPLLGKLNEKLHIDTGRPSWAWFRRARTVFLISMCWMVLCTYSMSIYLAMMKFGFTHVCRVVSLDYFLTINSLNYTDVILMITGCVLLFLSDLCVFRGETIFKVMDRQNAGVRTAVIYAEILTIFLYGMVGSSAFIYFQF